MAHSIRAIIGTDKVVSAIRDRFPVAVQVVLPQGLAMCPLTDDLYDAVAFEPGAGDPTQDVEGFYFPTKPLDDLLLALSNTAPVVYVETEYFGGVGTQAASAYERGRLRSRESSEDPGPINRALAWLGVDKGDQYDEFDALGLGRHRHTEDWEQEADGS